MLIQSHGQKTVTKDYFSKSISRSDITKLKDNFLLILQQYIPEPIFDKMRNMQCFDCGSNFYQKISFNRLGKSLTKNGFISKPIIINDTEAITRAPPLYF